MIEISENIKKEALKLVSLDETKLPVRITNHPQFYVADINDKTVMSFGVVIFEGKKFKIGTIK